MKNVVSVSGIRRAERAAIESGLDEDMLIESAAAAAYSYVKGKYHNAAVVYGGGNNGADGLSIARLLSCDGVDVTTVCVGDKINSAAEKRLKAALYCGAKVGGIESLKGVELIVDAIFGIGLDRQVSGEFKRAIEAINDSDAYVMSVDVPSGLNADSGEIMGCAVNADLTVTFGAVKVGLLLGEGRNVCGQIAAESIGLKPEPLGFINDKEIERRKTVSNKSCYGRVYVIGGSPSMPGAPYMTAMSASAAGAGYVTLCPPASMRGDYSARAVMFMLNCLADREGYIQEDRGALDAIMNKADCIVIGNGCGANPALKDIIGYLCRNYTKTLIVDADGINAIKDDLSVIDKHKCKLIFTPHTGEFNRLCGKVGGVIERAVKFCNERGCVIAVKDATTVITDGERILFNISGSPALAKGGSGDVLAGIAAAYACRTDPFGAIAAACYKLGKSAEKLYGQRENGFNFDEFIYALS